MFLQMRGKPCGSRMLSRASEGFNVKGSRAVLKSAPTEAIANGDILKVAGKDPKWPNRERMFPNGAHWDDMY